MEQYIGLSLEDQFVYGLTPDDIDLSNGGTSDTENNTTRPEQSTPDSDRFITNHYIPGLGSEEGEDMINTRIEQLHELFPNASGITCGEARNPETLKRIELEGVVGFYSVNTGNSNGSNYPAA